MGVINFLNYLIVAVKMDDPSSQFKIASQIFLSV